MNRVSLIIPCFKDSKTLSRALDSAYAQTHKLYEVIVVNDASPESEEIEWVLLNYPYVKYFVNPENKGLAATRNAGVNFSSGDIICFLDADDELHPQKIEIQMRLYSPDVALSCNVERVYKEVAKSRKIFDNIKYIKFKDVKKNIKKNNLTGASLMISKKLFIKIGGYDDRLRSCEDFDLWLRILSSGVEVINIQLPLYIYRIRSDSLSQNFLSISYWELQVVKKFYKEELGHIKFSTAIVIALWLFRHMIRYEKCLEPNLKDLIISNLHILRPCPMVYYFLNFLKIIKIPKLVNVTVRLLK
jgi:glycosyltransferase involved in cell wall biosynthesis